MRRGLNAQTCDRASDVIRQQRCPNASSSLPASRHRRAARDCRARPHHRRQGGHASLKGMRLI